MLWQTVIYSSRWEQTIQLRTPHQWFLFFPASPRKPRHAASPPPDTGAAAAPARLLPPAGERRPRRPHSSRTGPTPPRVPAATAASSSLNGREWSALFPDDPGESVATHRPPSSAPASACGRGVRVAGTRGDAAPPRETSQAKILRDFYRPVFLHLQR